MRRNKSTIDEEGSGEPPHKVRFPRRNSELSLRFLPSSGSNSPGSFCSRAIRISNGASISVFFITKPFLDLYLLIQSFVHSFIQTFIH